MHPILHGIIIAAAVVGGILVVGILVLLVLLTLFPAGEYMEDNDEKESTHE